jgi:hypothetical protein
VRRVDEILSMRVDAKRAGDFPRADHLRSQLRGMGTRLPPTLPPALLPRGRTRLGLPARVRAALAAAALALAAVTSASPSQVWR